MATWNDKCTESDTEYYPTSLNDNEPVASDGCYSSSSYDYYGNNATCDVPSFPVDYTNYEEPFPNTNPNTQQSYVGFQQFITQFQQSSLVEPSGNVINMGDFSGMTVYNTDIPISSNLTPTATEFVPRSMLKYNTECGITNSANNCVISDSTSEMTYVDKNTDQFGPYSENIDGMSGHSRDWWQKYGPVQDESQERSSSNERSKWKSIKETTQESIETNNKPNYRNYDSRDKRRNYSRNSDRDVADSSSYDKNGFGRRRDWEDQKRSNANNTRDWYQSSKNRSDRRYNDNSRYDNYNSEPQRVNKDYRGGNGREYFKRDKNNRYDGSYQSRNNYDRNSKDSDQSSYEYSNKNSYDQKCLEGEKSNTSDYGMKRSSKNFSKEENVKIEQDSRGSQRERLTLALDRGTLECLVCCERVKPQQSVWSCLGCYHVLHLACVSKWASTSKADNGWRCPACQRLCKEIPTAYYCFCQKVHNPHYNRHECAHSCGQTCARPGAEPCVHSCTLLCHPGPCPPCQAQVNRKCGCGRTSRLVQCSQLEVLLCDAICNKELNCGQHKCENKCHEGPCPNCEQKIKQECYCGKETKEVTCTMETALVTQYTCESICESTLNCGKHKCQQLCHIGACEPCTLDPEKVETCPCGKMPLPEDCRTSCLDPVPVCGEVCDKPLKCGPPSQPHKCANLCHEGPCPVCPLETLVRCRCGHMDREMQCSLLTTRADDARCQKKCTKKRECGRHKCNAPCCIAVEHPCPLPCSHMLSCGLHRCDQNCHRGRCQPCWRSSFSELTCECGASIRHPPVPCGARRPLCDRLCSRQHACDHPVMHTCHGDPECPPCTVLSSKWCHGKHEMRKTIPCHQTDFSCGKPCGRALPCGRHACQLPCHKGACLTEGRSCTQSCATPRASCGHACKAPCHDGSCPDTPCREMVKVTCQCKHRSTTRACADTTRDYQRIATAMFASKMADMQRGETINIQDILSNRGGANLKTLECTDECRLVERNRRMTVGLQIRNPDLSNKLSPRYSDFLKQWAKRDPSFVQNIHDKLTELVRLAKQSKQKFRSHSFPVMNREKRQVVHEMCEQFGVEGEAYDAEPNRNVVATADKEKSWLPSMSLLEVVQRESGQRKVPVPSMGIRASRNN